jgi:heme/copper-type cytochrome/quinol oxidase subunit 2
MKKLKKFWWIIPIVIVLIGIGIYFSQPKYKVIQLTRALAWGNQPSNFIMSPAKIEITRLVWGFPLTIPVKIINSAGDMTYSVGFQDPSIFDAGYINADGNNDYSYSWDKSTVDVKNNTTEVVNIKISKRSLFGSSGIEKGIAISQSPNGSQINIGFSYVFEILIGGSK